MAWSTRHGLALLVVATGLGVPLLLWWRALPAGAAERPAPRLPGPMEGPPPRKALPALAPEHPFEPEPAPGQAATLALQVDPEALPANLGLVLALSGPGGLRVTRPLAGALVEAADLVPGRWRLSVAPGPVGALGEPLWEREIDLEPGQRHESALPPLALAVLEGELTLRGSTAEPEALTLPVRLFARGGWREALPDAAGRFRFTGLMPGKGLLIAGGGPAAGLSGACKEVTLAAGKTSRVVLEVQRR